MKKRTLIILAIIPIIGLLFPLAWLNYQTQQDSNFQPPQYLEYYLLAGFIIAEIALSISSWYRQDKNNLREDRKTHSKEFLDALNILDGADISVTKTKFDVCVPYPYKNFKLNQSIMWKTAGTFDAIKEAAGNAPHYNWVSYLGSDEANFEGLIEHLQHKKYKDSYDKWKKLQKRVGEHSKQYHPYPDKELSNYELLKFYDDSFEIDGFRESQSDCVKRLGEFVISLQPLKKDLKGVKIIEGNCQWCPS